MPTGKLCERGHPLFIEIRTVEIHGVEHPDGQIGPSCWRTSCPAHLEFKRNELQHEL
jgi:hypothetical protein